VNFGPIFERVGICMWDAIMLQTLRPPSNEFRETLEGHNEVNLGMHSESVIE
jgi:hypothetical protein